MDFTQYWFMFPVSICVATCAMLSGIGGAALFTPIFILIFPLLGPEYVLQTTYAAIGTALLTQTFGFLSGFIGYYRRRLIDFGLAFRFMKVSVPVAVAGAFLAHLVHEGILVGAYALLVATLAISILFLRYQTADIVTVSGFDGAPRLDARGTAVTGVGAFLTGMVSVGIGEVTVSQLTKRGIPVGVAAATSVAVVIVTVTFASSTLIAQMIRDGGFNAVPWNLVCYTIPGVLIGGQIGPLLQGSVPQRNMERAIGVLFLVLAAAMAGVALRKFGL